MTSKINVQTWGDRTAIVESDTGNTFTFRELAVASAGLAKILKDDGWLNLSPANNAKTHQPSIAMLARPSATYAVMMLGAWLANAVCVPLSSSHTNKDVSYIVGNSDANVLLLQEGVTLPAAQNSSLAAAADSIPAPITTVPSIAELSAIGAPLLGGMLDNLATPHNRGALVIYTSGTTGKPKGGHSHFNA